MDVFLQCSDIFCLAALSPTVVARAADPVVLVEASNLQPTSDGLQPIPAMAYFPEHIEPMMHSSPRFLLGLSPGKGTPPTRGPRAAGATGASCWDSLMASCVGERMGWELRVRTTHPLRFWTIHHVISPFGFFFLLIPLRKTRQNFWFERCNLSPFHGEVHRLV